MAAAASWGFPVSRAARRRLDHPQGLVVDPTGAADLPVGRRLAAKLGVSSADLVAAALVNEALRVVARCYREQAAPAAFVDALASLEQRAGPEAVAPTLDRPVEAYAPEPAVAPATAASTPPAPPMPVARPRALEELLLLWLANENPACRPLRELFDTKELEAHGTATSSALWASSSPGSRSSVPTARTSSPCCAARRSHSPIR